MFVGVSGHRCIMASLDDFGPELLVVGNVQPLFVVKESVHFFPFKKVVDQTSGAFLAQDI